MAIKDKIQNQFSSYTDPYTGVTVKRLTAPDHVSHHMYFYNKMTTKEGKTLIYCAELPNKEKGKKERQHYLMDHETGEAVQIK